MGKKVLLEEFLRDEGIMRKSGTLKEGDSVSPKGAQRRPRPHLACGRVLHPTTLRATQPCLVL
jgi:hypothetical protein